MGKVGQGYASSAPPGGKTARRRRVGASRRANDQGPGAKYGIIGKSQRVVEAISLIHKVAASNVTAVLLEGESGTGKDLVARAVHSASARRDNPFMEINCAAIPESLLESELMGHEQGSFTGANSRKIGLFELANGGTVLLDEISELRLDLQAKLLRIVETRSFKRVGGIEEIRVDARMITTTNRDLAEAVRQRSFREDLYYRLKVIPIHLPPLRERNGDLPLLAEHFISRFNVELGKHVRQVSDEAFELLSKHPWPGNVREFKNVMERALLLGDGDTILAHHLPSDIRNGQPASHGGRPYSGSLQLTHDGVNLEELERDLIRQSLDLSGGNQVKAAKLLGLGRDALRYRMKKYDLLSAFSKRPPRGARA